MPAGPPFPPPDSLTPGETPAPARENRSHAVLPAPEPLSKPELDALIDFLSLLDKWDREKKIV